MNGGGWCVCGMAANDPTHDGWHGILTWNGRIFHDLKLKRDRDFEKRLETHDHMRGRKAPERQGSMAMDGMAAGGKTYQR